MEQRPETDPYLKDQLKNMKMVEQALRESEERFRVAQELSPDGFTLMKPLLDENGKLIDFIFTYENQAVAKMNGTNPDEVVGKRLLQLFPGHEDTKFFKTYKEVFETKKNIEFEDHYKGETIHKDKWFRIVTVPTLDGIAILAQDITERKKSELELKVSEERFRTLADNISQFAWMADEKGWIFWYNKRWYDYTGTNLEEMQGWGWQKVHHPDHVGNVTEKFKYSIDTGEPWEDTFPIKGKDGEYRWFLSRALPIKDEKGNTLRWFGTNTDITDLKRSEEARLDSEEKLLEAQNLAHMCSFIFDFEQNKIEWTQEFLNIYELDSDEMYQTIEHLMDLVHPDDRQYVLENVRHAIENKMESLQIEYRIITGKGNVKYVNYRGKLSYNSQGKHTKRFGTIIDITDRKLQELELRRTLENLERSNKDLEQYAYVASHDLQEPLRMVSIYSTILERNLKGTLDEMNNQYLEILIESSKRMNSLVTGLLEYSRITSQKEKLTDVDMNNIVSEVLKDLSFTINETKAEVIAEDLPIVKANPIQMKLLMQNLISNAIKFTAKDVKPCIEIKGERKGRTVVYSVKDNGIGISPENYERIFVIFHRLHSRDVYSGTGIGLTLCKRIVENHGGRIWVESKKEEGSTFYFSLGDSILFI